MAGVDVSATNQTNRAADSLKPPQHCGDTTIGSLTLTSAPAEGTLVPFARGARGQCKKRKPPQMRG